MRGMFSREPQTDSSMKGGKPGKAYSSLTVLPRPTGSNGSLDLHLELSFDDKHRFPSAGLIWGEDEGNLSKQAFLVPHPERPPWNTDPSCQRLVMGQDLSHVHMLQVCTAPSTVHF